MPSCAKSPNSATGYMPMQPATRGTLSTMLESTPIIPVTKKWLPSNAVFKPVPNCVSTPIVSRQATAIKMPKKKRMVDMSMRESMLVTRFCIAPFSSA